MNVKVQCTCGQAYSFDIEPVNGAMPCTVACPTCNADGTQLANQAILESQFTPPPTDAPPASGLRINRAAPTAAPVAAAAPAEPPKRFGYTRTLEPDKAPPPSNENILMGIVGGAVAGFIAMLIWYSLALATDHEFGIVAWGVGVVAGLGVRILGKDGTPVLGFIAAVCACVAILGGEFLVVSHYTNQFMRTFASTAYEKELSVAREATHINTDAEIRNWLEQHDKKGDSVSPGDIEEFRAHTQAKMQDFVDGKPAQAEFEKLFIAKTTSFSMKFDILKKTISLFTVLWLIFGILSAYRIGSS